MLQTGRRCVTTKAAIYYNQGGDVLRSRLLPSGRGCVTIKAATHYNQGGVVLQPRRRYTTMRAVMYQGNMSLDQPHPECTAFRRPNG